MFIPNPFDSTKGDNADTINTDWRLCELAIEIFEDIELKASKQCAEVVRQFMARWASRASRGRSRSNEEPETSSKGYTTIESQEKCLNCVEAPPAGSHNEEETFHPTSAKASGSMPSHLTPSGWFGSGAMSNSNMTPTTYLSGLQAELYSTLYSNELSDSLGVPAQTYLIGNDDAQGIEIGPGCDKWLDGASSGSQSNGF
jgi:hypothetical protein